MSLSAMQFASVSVMVTEKARTGLYTSVCDNTTKAIFQFTLCSSFNFWNQ